MSENFLAYFALSYLCETVKDHEEQALSNKYKINLIELSFDL